MKLNPLALCGTLSLAVTSIAFAEITITSEFDESGSGFRFKTVPLPARDDAATGKVFTVIDGQSDPNGASRRCLTDGRVATTEDQPGECFFFAPGTDGGRLQLDLGTNVAIRQINSYSWHRESRGPQVYRVFGSEGSGSGFNPSPRRGEKPESCGWTLLGSVDTRPKEGPGGGQYGVSLADTSGVIGRYRFLLFEVSRTEDKDPFGNTFYTEIDVIARDGAHGTAIGAAGAGRPDPVAKKFDAAHGKYHFTVDTTIAPDLTDWADQQLRPIVQEWYPKLVEMLPSEGFSARTNLTIRFRDDMRGTPASAGGGFINCNADWFRRELKREALGSVVHEMVHVVQSYGRGPRGDTNYTRIPGWLVEGIPDYIRWYIYEPQTKGAEITQRNLARAKYDASYRVSANFLNWVSEKYDTNIVRKLNAAGRAGRYRDAIWKESTGKTVEELGAEWKRFHESRLASNGGGSAKPVAP